MEENEGTSSIVELSTFPQIEESTTEPKLIDIQELELTQKCNFISDSVPKLDDLTHSVDDSKWTKEEEILVEVNQMEKETNMNHVNELKNELMGLNNDGEAVAEEESLDELERETNMVRGGHREFVTESNDLQVVGAESVSDVKDDRVVMEEAGIKMEMELKANAIAELGVVAELKSDSMVEAGTESKAEADVKTIVDSKEEVEAKAEEVKAKLDVGTESLIVGDYNKEYEVVVEGVIPTADTIAEMEQTIENGGGGENYGEVNSKEVVGNGSPSVAEEAGAGENLEVIGTDFHNVAEEAAVEEAKVMEMDNKKEAEVVKVDTGEPIYPVDGPQYAEDDTMEMITKKESEEEKVDRRESIPPLDDTKLVEEERVVVEDKTPDAQTEMETEEEVELERVDGGESAPKLDNSELSEGEEDETTVAEEEAPAAGTEMETEIDAAESVKVSGGNRKRRRNPKVPTKSPGRKTVTIEEEDVCFICFDGGELVLCDRKNCPKAYHPSCVNHDEKFFRSKGRWNCGWHQCSNCQKNAYYMCYTCTFSLCKGCIKDAVILCVRGNKGFCETCMKTVMLIEDTEQGNKEQANFDDKNSWEYLFKDYFIDLKERLSLSSVELAQAKNRWKGSEVAGKYESADEQLDVKDDGRSGSENPSDNAEASKSKRRRAKKRPKSLSKGDGLTTEAVVYGAEGISTPKNTEWASKELLEFVMHMKDGDRSVLSQFDVQALLLEYIKRNKLRDPRRKSQIICDARFENIFGKARVGHFEMLKLLESHFLVKEDAQIEDVQGSVVNTETNHLDGDANTESPRKGGKDKKRKTRKKDGRGPQSNLDDYAAIDIHNISLIFLRRKLMEDLLDDIELFPSKVIGTFVRIRISGSNQKQDIYRLVQVVGTSKAAELYKVGKRTTDIMLEILNLNKTEVISIDTISNQEFTEDECKRLRQSIKCGLINRMTVGEILDKAMELQVARVNDWLESETVRLSHLRDRASDLGRKKNLRECVEKLQILKTPEERRRRLEDVPEIHTDPKMDPSYESEDDDSEMESNKQELFTRPRGSGFNRRGREPISPGRGELKDSWSDPWKNSGKNWELNRNLSNKNLANRVEDANLNIEKSADISLNPGRDKYTEQLNNLEKPSSATRSEAFGLNDHSIVSETSRASMSAPVVTTYVNISETDKVWHYQDPSGKVQGPFSIVQLRKWNNSGYFPANLSIWRTTGNKDDSMFLTDVLAGKFHGELSLVDNGYTKDDTLLNPHLPPSEKPYKTSSQRVREGQVGGKLNSDLNHGALDSHVNLASRSWTAPSVDIPMLSANRINSDYVGRNNSVNLPSPTPKQSTAGWVGEVSTPTPATPISFPGGNEAVQSPTAVTQDGGRKPIMMSEKNPLSSHAGFNAAPDSQHSLQTSQLAAPVESHGLQTHSHLLPTLENAVNMVQYVTSQNPAFGTQGWNATPSQSLEANCSVQVPLQQLSYGQWGGVPSTIVQNPAGNFSAQGGSPMPPPDPWRPPNPNNQNNMQPPVQSNVPWGMGIAENNVSALNMQPENPNSGWGFMTGNPNMGWGGHVPNPSMNWVAPVQGPPPANANPGWGVQAGNSGTAFQGAVPGNLNPGWAAPGNANQGWVTPPGKLGPTAQGPIPGNGNQGWTAPAGNLGANVQGPASGNANSGWSPQAGNQGNQRSEHHHRGDRFSGQRDRNRDRDWDHDRRSQGGDSGYGGGRPRNRQSSFGGGGQGSSSQTCLFFQQKGHCKKGDHCDYRHS